MDEKEFAAVITQLSEKFRPEQIKQLEQSGNIIDYIDWPTAAGRLDDVVPNWEFKITRVQVINTPDGQKLVVTGGVVIDGIIRENIGFENIGYGISKNIQGGVGGYGDAFTNAFSQAFKRSAASWGVARHLYTEKREAIASQNASLSADAPKPSPKPKVTAKAGEKIPATLTGIEHDKKDGRPYSYLSIDIGERYPKRFFFDDNYTEKDLFNDINVPEVAYPTKCMITLKQVGKYQNVNGFFPVEAQEEAPFEATKEMVPF